MIPFLDRLNLRPQERRFVVVVGLILFVVINVVWVRPRFKDWSRLQNEIQEARRTLDRYKAEADKLPQYRATLARLEGETPVVLPAEQAIQLFTTVQSQVQQHGVAYTQIRPVGASAASRTNAFFEEQSVVVSYVNTGEKELVDFLSSFATGTSMIRVRDMDIKPDPSQTRLMGSITLVATYQKKPPTPVRPAVAAQTAPATKTASAGPAGETSNTPQPQSASTVKPTPPARTNRPSASIAPPATAPSARTVAPPSARLTNTTVQSP